MPTDGSGVVIDSNYKLEINGVPDPQNAPNTVGIYFSEDAQPPQGTNQSFTWIQIIQTTQSTYINTTGVFNQPTTPGQGLDGTYPYASQGSFNTVDTPNSGLPANYGEGARNFTATMYVMSDPGFPAGCTPASTSPTTYKSTASTCTQSIPIPLGSVQWHWSGCAINPLVQQTNAQSDIAAIAINNAEYLMVPSFRVALAEWYK